MKNVTRSLQDIYLPVVALLMYQHQLEDSCYIETYDITESGRPINARPLTIAEAADIAALLQTSSADNTFLRLNGLLPANLIYLDTSKNSCVMWYTPPRKMQLFFTKQLSIPCGKAWVPGLLWKADREDLYIYALSGKTRPNLKTPLYHAPFFNVYEEGRVCMGTVDTEITNNLSLEAFIKAWEDYFFNSYFSHVIGGASPVQGNIIQLWQEQVNTNRRFPQDCLKKHTLTLKKILPC
ncbi:MAG: PRTRC system protein B [Niabella sp.]